MKNDKMLQIYNLNKKLNEFHNSLDLKQQNLLTKSIMEHIDNFTKPS